MSEPLTPCPDCGTHAPPRTCHCPECGAKIATCSRPRITVAMALLGLTACGVLATPQPLYGATITLDTIDTAELVDTSDTGLP